MRKRDWAKNLNASSSFYDKKTQKGKLGKTRDSKPTAKIRRNAGKYCLQRKGIATESE